MYVIPVRQNCRGKTCTAVSCTEDVVWLPPSVDQLSVGGCFWNTGCLDVGPVSVVTSCLLILVVTAVVKFHLAAIVLFKIRGSLFAVEGGGEVGSKWVDTAKVG